MGVDRGIVLEVIEADALSYRTDVLVLKHAQAAYGVDARVERLLGLSLEGDLLPGSHLIVAGSDSIGADRALFVGVNRLPEFGYPQIRSFARRALAILGEDGTTPSEVAFTLHGVGYGLDEIACLDSEVAGLMDALGAGEGPPSVSRIVILERDSGRVRRINEHLSQLFPTAAEGTFTIEIGSVDTTERLGQVTADAAPGDHAFVAMPFAPEFEDVFDYGISAAVRNNGLLCERIDRSVYTGDILSRVKAKIRSAKLLVADLTGANPNVYLEVGYAWAAEIPTVLLRRGESELMFDVRGERCLSYGSIKELEIALTAELGHLLG